jgi:hypothetical protein
MPPPVDGKAESAPAAQPPAVAPAAVKPSAVRRRAAVRAAPPTREFRSGDLVCAGCGEGNDPERKFCSRCGASLAAATVHVEKVPWYRRLLARLPIPGRAAPAAGEKPATRRRRRWIRLINAARVSRSSLSLALVVVLLAYAIIPPFRSWVNARASSVQTAVQRLVSPTFEPVHALSATASSALPDHPPSAAIDGYNNTYWATDLTQDGQPTLVLSFPRPVTINVMLFTSGSSGDFTSEPRPMQVHIVFSNGAAQDVHLADQAKPQQIHIENADGVVQMEIHITSVYPSIHGNNVSLTEMEMFARN